MDEGETRNNAILDIMQRLRGSDDPTVQYGMAPVN